MELNVKAIAWLESRGMELETVLRSGVTSSGRGADIIEFPYMVRGEKVNTKYRNIVDKSFTQDANGYKCVWNFDCLLDETLKDQPLIITEGEMDALTFIQCGFARVVSVPDGAPAKTIEGESQKYTYLEDLMKLIEDCKEIIIAADSDQAGANLLHDLALRLGKTRCKYVPYPKGCKDINDALQTYGQKGVVESYSRAKWVQVDGYYRMSELPPVPEAKPHTTGISWLDEHYNVRFGDFCVITGVPSYGKSTFVNHLVSSLVDTHGVTACFASFEQHPSLDHKRNLRRYKIGRAGGWNEEEKLLADAWIDENFIFLAPNEDDDVTLDWVLEKASAAVVRENAQVVVIDPWNELDHMRPNGMSLTEYTGYAIKQLKKFARKHHIHLIIVAHPTKMKKVEGIYEIPTLYDISDSAHWYNKADIGIIVHRQDEETSIIKVAKSRYHDLIGKPGEVVVRFNKSNNRFEKRGATYSAE